VKHVDVLVVGGGHGGAQVAIALRQRKFQGSIAIVGDEPHLPYERPPLSKEYLSGEKPFERILIRPPMFWAERQIDMLLGNRVIAVDPVRHYVRLGSGEAIKYSKLVWAAGGIARQLNCAGHDLEGVHVIRSRADVDSMLRGMECANRVIIVGGGYIGLEAAAALSKCNKKITVVESQDRVLARVAGEPLSRFYEAEHCAHGVDIRLSTGVDCIKGSNGRVVGVQISTGEYVPAELVIVGIGIIPAIEPLRQAGASGDNGVDVDAGCRTNLPGIFAIGDCAAHVSGFAGDTVVRLESVQNATDQAMIVARQLTGEPAVYDAVPWFWSNQYNLRLQTVGLSSGHDQAVLRGHVEERRFSIVYLRRGQVIALDCINSTKDYVEGRALVTRKSVLKASELADSSVSLKSLAERVPIQL
jgi:3-phenylpropionate/trans-cinnamate dioxygenase ferredoxin reductase component